MVNIGGRSFQNSSATGVFGESSRLQLVAAMLARDTSSVAIGAMREPDAWNFNSTLVGFVELEADTGGVVFLMLTYKQEQGRASFSR